MAPDKPTTLLEIARTIAAEDPTFQAVLGPGAGDHSTQAFMRRLRESVQVGAVPDRHTEQPQRVARRNAPQGRGEAGGGAAVWAHLADVPPLSSALYVILSSAGTLWTVLGILWLWREMRPSSERVAFECAYGLALDGLQIAKDDAQVPLAIQLAIVLRNASSLPLKYKVEEIHVIVGTTAIPYPDLVNDGGLISRGCTGMYFYPPFPKNVIQPKVSALVEFTIAYGHPDYGLARRLKKKLDVSLRLDDKPGVVYLTRSESDEEIRQPIHA